MISQLSVISKTALPRPLVGILAHVAQALVPTLLSESGQFEPTLSH
jgi:hypothetical protein